MEKTLTEGEGMTAGGESARAPYGVRAPGKFDAAVIAATSRLPGHWLGRRLAILLRRLVTMRLSGDDGLDVERWGLRMRLHPRRNGCEKELLFTPQHFEVPERQALAARIAVARSEGRPFMFVDIGANVGLFSLFVVAASEGATRILAVEPEPENVRRLRFNIAANGALPIHVAPHALSEGEGVGAIEPHPRDRGGTRVRAMDASMVYGADVVRCRALADVLVEAGIDSVDALKIDVEGAEDRILIPFFERPLERLWPYFLIIEDSSGIWKTDLFELLRTRGYRIVGRSRINVMMER